MDVSLVLKAAGIGILIAVTCQILNRAGREDQSLMLSLLGVVLGLLLLVEELGEVIAQVRAVFGL